MKVMMIYKKTKKSVTNNYLDNITFLIQQRGLEVTLARINKFEEIDSIIDNLKYNKYRKVIIIGGEITINMVLNSIIKYDVNLPMNIFPLGLENNFSSLFEMPSNTDEMIDVILDKSISVDRKDLEFAYNWHNLYQTNDFLRLFKLNKISKGFKTISKEAKGSVKDSYSVIKDLPRHRVFSYINRNSLNRDYFETAEKALDNGYIYIILSSTGSSAGELIRRVTREDYSHISISFDEELKTMISYNNGNGKNSPGLNQETLDYFFQKPHANFIIYKLKASKYQKSKILSEIKRINRQGSSYNLLGIFLPYPRKRNIMFCSQFVYTMLKTVGLDYFELKSNYIKPIDFIDYDENRNLEYYKRVFKRDISIAQ